MVHCVETAFERSKKNAPVKPPLSRLCSMLSVNEQEHLQLKVYGENQIDLE